MSNIIKQRRVSAMVERTVYEPKAVLNPEYNERDYIHDKVNQSWYGRNKYISIKMPKLKLVRTSHVEYLIRCEKCNVKCWVRRCDSRFCSPTCRKVAYLERQAAKETSEKKEILLPNNLKK